MQARTIQSDGISIFAEHFGNPQDPPILLIMGAMASGVWWPEELCASIAARGRFVIRYDHRDTGRSTSYEPGAPRYGVEDLADDAVRVLDGYGIEQAHLVGMSLGGYLAQLIALKHPRRVLTLTLIASERLASADPELPGMAPELLAYHARGAELDWSNHEDVIAYQVGAWRLLAGSAHPFDAASIREMATEDLARTPNPLTAFNHATLQDATGWIDRMSEIRAPALILHGTEDIVLPYAHAEALHAALPQSRLVALRGTGHELPRGDWPVIIDELVRHTAGNGSPEASPASVHTIVVPRPPAESFAHFAERLSQWWPREYTWSHTVLEDIGMEPRAGGMCYERGPHGFRCDWGRVLAWEPPHRLEFAWQIGPRREPVPDPARASTVVVRFEDAAGGTTRVTLEHRDFERHGEGAAEYRAAMSSPQGWPYIVERFAASLAP